MRRRLNPCRFKLRRLEDNVNCHRPQKLQFMLESGSTCQASRQDRPSPDATLERQKRWRNNINTDQPYSAWERKECSRCVWDLVCPALVPAESPPRTIAPGEGPDLLRLTCAARSPFDYRRPSSTRASRSLKGNTQRLLLLARSLLLTPVTPVDGAGCTDVSSALALHS